MIYDARQIANWFVKRAQRDNRVVSIMSLLKLCYIAHGWRLEIKDEPLFSNEVEAWQYGPVIPDVYKAFRRQGVDVSAVVPIDANEISDKDEAFLEQIYKIYGGMGAFQLSEITHVPDGPWDIATRTGGNYARIPNALIKQHYADKRRRAAS